MILNKGRVLITLLTTTFSLTIFSYQLQHSVPYKKNTPPPTVSLDLEQKQNKI